MQRHVLWHKVMGHDKYAEYHDEIINNLGHYLIAFRPYTTPFVLSTFSLCCPLPNLASHMLSRVVDRYVTE